VPSKITNENARRWRLMALEAFAIASYMNDPECRATMLRIAAGYDHLAEMAETEVTHAPTEPSLSKPEH
jgi:hypothetical protein